MRRKYVNTLTKLAGLQQQFLGFLFHCNLAAIELHYVSSITERNAIWR